MITARTFRWMFVLLAAASLGVGTALAGVGTAQATVPDAWGYALVQKPSGPVDPMHWAESVPSPVPTAAPGAPGQVTVKFPKIGFFKNGVVHVTAVIDELAWCDAQSWRPLGGNELVTVRCYTKGGVPTFVPFTVMFSASSGVIAGPLRYAYVHDNSAAVVTSFNSTGMANSVTNLGPGKWLVKLRGPGPASPVGGVQVTAVKKAAAAICDVAGRAFTATAQLIKVDCYNAAGVPTPSGWNLTYQRARAITGAMPKHFAYTVNNQPGNPGYVPAPPSVNVNSLAGVNSIANSFATALVKLPHVGLKPDIVFVTAAASVASVCNLNTVWGTAAGTALVRDVVCYRTSGAMAPSKSFVTYTSKS
jgi:hypothetical protein